MRTASRGYSLLELLVVVLLISLMATLVMTNAIGTLDKARVRAASRDLVAGLRHTRGLAVVKGEARVFELDLRQRAWRAAERDWVELPEGLDLKLLTAAQEVTGDGRGQIRFYPDGASTGGTVTVIGDGRQWQIKVAWLTGEIKLEESRS